MLTSISKVLRSTNVRNKWKVKEKLEKLMSEGENPNLFKKEILTDSTIFDSSSSRYTKKEVTALKSFRAKITDFHLDWFDCHDDNLMKWLKAGDMNVHKAHRLFQKNQKWRRENDIDNILKESLPEFLLNDFPLQVPGYDNDGDLVVIIPFGRWNFRRIVEECLETDFTHYLHYIIQVTYELARARYTRDKVNSKITLILDLKGFDLNAILHMPTIGFLLEILRTLTDNHPETLKAAYFLNCEKSCEIFWTIAKPVLTFRTVSKVRIMDCDEESWKRKLLKHIQPPNLPVEYGGTYTSVPNFSHLYPLIIFALTVQSKLHFMIDEVLGHRFQHVGPASSERTSIYCQS